MKVPSQTFRIRVGVLSALLVVTLWVCFANGEAQRSTWAFHFYPNPADWALRKETTTPLLRYGERARTLTELQVGPFEFSSTKITPHDALARAIEKFQFGNPEAGQTERIQFTVGMKLYDPLTSNLFSTVLAVDPSYEFPNGEVAPAIKVVDPNERELPRWVPQDQMQGALIDVK